MGDISRYTHLTIPANELLNALTVKVDRPQLSPADVKRLQAAMVEKAKRD